MSPSHLPWKALLRAMAAAMMLWGFLIQPAHAAHKRALLIGVHLYSYGPDGVFSDLNTESDVAAVKQVLIEHFGFADSDITVLTSGPETTRSAILKAMQDVLVTPTQAGDVLYFHYSGHGSQVPDPTDPSGVDETLVPSDWSQDGAMDIRDKEIRRVIGQIKDKHPANLTMSFDSCHSGTVTRGGRMLVRGVSFQKRFGKPMPGPSNNTKSANQTRGGKAPAGGAFSALASTQTADGTTTVVISACRDDQSAVETEDENHVQMGRLTYLLCGALRSAGPETTYQDLFERIDSLMRQKFTDTRQDPQIEGDSNQVLLGKTAIVTPPYLMVENNFLTGTRLAAGTLQGMTPGSTFALYPAGARAFTPATQIATAKIVTARLLSSKLEIVSKVRPDIDLTAARAIEISHQYGDARIKVAADNLGPANAALLAALKANDGVAVVGKSDLPDITLARQETSFVLIREDGGAEIGRFAAGADQIEQMNSVLKREIQWRFVRALSNADPNSAIGLEIRIVPARVSGNDDEGYTFLADKPLSRGPITLTDADAATVEVRNIGTVDAYVTVLDVQNDASVQQLWPTPNQTVSESLIPHGQPDRWQKLMQDPTHPMIVRFAGSHGAETFKAIATREKVDFKTLTTRDKLSPIERMLRSASAGTRAQVSVTPSLWSTAAIAFTVAPPEEAK